MAITQWGSRNRPPHVDPLVAETHVDSNHLGPSVAARTARTAGIAGIAENGEVTLYDSTPGVRPDRHLKDDELQWFDFDPVPFVEFVRNAEFGRNEELAARMATIRRAAWGCESFLVFGPPVIGPRDTVPTNPVVASGTDELVFDLDGDGNPVALEFTSHDCGAP